MAEPTARTVLVTGACGGLGQAMVAAFVQAGWRVVGTDLREPKSFAGERFLRADLAQASPIERLFTELAGFLPQLDALVNNAAQQLCSTLEATEVEQWDQVLAVNLRAPYLCTQKALPLLRRAPSASVVNVASVHALATSPQIAAYAASKGGLVALTRAAALELAAEGLRVNAVLPGAVDTPMLREGLMRGGSAQDGIEARMAAFAARHPLQRVARPDEIAQTVLFLADAERSSYITGAALVVDGGVTSRLSTE